MIKVAEAPSVRKEELAAVCVPWGLMKAGDSFDTFSSVVSPLIPFSVCGEWGMGNELEVKIKCNGKNRNAIWKERCSGAY